MADIRYEVGNISEESFLALAQRVWPRPYDRARTREALERTVNIGAWDDHRLVGVVRVLTDGYFFATIPEILVDPEYQRRGLGRELMNRSLLHAPRGIVFFGAQPQSLGFFDRLGCARELTGFTFGCARPFSDSPRASKIVR